MSIFLNGLAPDTATKAARVAAIKAVITSGTYIKTRTDGSKYVDTTALNDYLGKELVKIGSSTISAAEGDDVPAGRRTYVVAASKTVSLPAITDPYASALDRSTWVDDKDYPKGNTQTNAEKAAALIELKRKLQAAVGRLQEHYDAQRKEMLDAANSTAYQAVVAEFLPEVTVRNTESRSYIYTYVNDWGWESAPSPPTALIDVDDNDEVTVVARIPPDGATSPTFKITGMRLYRSSTTNSGAAFQFVVGTSGVADFTNLVTRTYKDLKKQSELGEVCPTMTWEPPPNKMVGLTGLPNGVMIGFEGNQIYLNEPFIPYAWPTAYRLTTEHKIVGIGTFGQSAIVLTEGYPYYVSGADSATMSAQKMEFNQACLAKRTIASADGGVLYCSPDGLCLANSSGVQIITEGVYSRRDWYAWPTSWASAFAEYHEGIYYLFDGTKALAIDIKGKKVSTIPSISASGGYSDLITDKLYISQGTSLLEMFGSASNSTAVWRSKTFINPGFTTFAAIRVESDFASSVIVRIYGSGSLVHTATFAQNTLPHNRTQRLPAGRWAEIEVEVEAACQVTRVSMATSMKELLQVNG